MTSAELPDHIFRPHVRPIQPVPVSKDGRQFVALRDPSMLMEQTMVVSVQAMQVVQHFQGKQSVNELAEQFKGEPAQFIQLAESMDQLGLLWGPTFERLETLRWDELQKQGAFPKRSSASLGDDAAAARAAIDGWFAETEDPELDAACRAIIAPHLDYERGWPNYAAAYYGLRGTDAPDRVVVLGTNHFGIGDGVVMTHLGFETPLGVAPPDTAVVNAMQEKLGAGITRDQIDHLGEHSIELQIPWIQYLFGDVPIVAALVPDPIVGMIEQDDERATLDQFVAALRETLDDAGGRTLFVASADLSHVGPQFGEPRPVDEQRRMDVERHDREMMGKFLAGDAEEFLGAMRWCKNPTRWCSIGSMAALLHLLQPATIELIDYRQAFDEPGSVLVSSAAMAAVLD